MFPRKVSLEHRICKSCGSAKPYGDGEYFRKNRHICRECERAASRERTFKHIRGISYEERDALLAAQGGACAACGSPKHNSKKGWHVDHCHRTGEIRAVLCANCNVALGQVDDDITHLLKLVEYLRKHRSEGATTIPQGSTPEAIAGGSARPLIIG